MNTSEMNISLCKHSGQSMILLLIIKMYLSKEILIIIVCFNFFDFFKISPLFAYLSLTIFLNPTFKYTASQDRYSNIITRYIHNVTS